jgi:membrane protein DedA with SNARE-associated domain
LAGFISSYIEHFTYLGLFVSLTLCGLGLPIPEDVALLVGGFLAYKGVTRYSITLIVALLGVIAGDNTLYFVGHGLGSNLFSYFRLKHPGAEVQLNRLHAFMHRHGHLAIFYARFFPGIRALVYLFAGSVRVPPHRFFFYDLAGAVISVPVVVTLGWRFGEQLDKAIRFISVFNRLIWMTIVLCVLALLARHLVLRHWHGGATGSRG